MSSIELNDVTSGYNLGKISDNFDRIERVINEEVLHRVNIDGTPNSMETDLDMNGQHIYNLPKPVMGSSPLRVKDMFGDPDELLGGPDRETIVAVAGQTVFTLSTGYVPGTNSLLVFRGGILQTDEYVESSSNTVTFPAGVDAGDEITFVPVAVTGGDVGTVDAVTSGSNIGTGSGVFSNRSGNSLIFKSLKQGSGITITPSTDEILISANNPSITASNIGATGEGVFAQKNGNNFEFKKIRAGSNVTVSSDSTGVVISSTGGGGSGTPVAVYDNGVLKTSEVTSLNFINTTVGVSGDAVTVQAPAALYVNVKDYGAVGDGVTNDSSAIQSAITAAKAANKSVFFPDGTYIISSLGVQSGRLYMYGTGSSLIKGTFQYHETGFTTSAATLTPLTHNSPYFHAENISFESTSSDYGLKLSTVQQTDFLTTFSLTNCRFYGNKGVLAQHMIGFEVTKCHFNNKVAGIRLEGCVNGAFTACRWQNQAESGVYIGPHATQVNRAGGENMRFVNCEWAVCTYGIIATDHMWLTIDSCLLDFCGTPLFLSGTNWAKALNTYFGASNVPTIVFSAIPGYIAPYAQGIAVVGRPGGTPIGSRVSGFTAHNCEFINYVVGATQPIVYIDGYVSPTYPLSCEEISFIDCLFYAAASHSAIDLLEISNCKIARVIANRFRSFNLSTSMGNAYRTASVLDWQNHSNSFWNCTQSGVQLGSAYEQGAGAVVSATEPTNPYPNMIWVTP